MFENEFTWYLYNVVIYDGVESKVLKFVLKTCFDENKEILSNEEIEYLKSYVKAYEEESIVCHIDKLYEVTLDNIIAFREVAEFAEIYDRFITMYFPCR